MVIEAPNDGANFYIEKCIEPKTQLTGLSNKISYALMRGQAEEELANLHKRSEESIT